MMRNSEGCGNYGFSVNASFQIGLERKLCKCLVRGSVSTSLPMLGFSYLNAATNHGNHVVVEIGNRELF